MLIVAEARARAASDARATMTRARERASACDRVDDDAIKSIERVNLARIVARSIVARRSAAYCEYCKTWIFNRHDVSSSSSRVDNPPSSS
jgi:hypothetical protein